jgi:hypothetical protein
VPPSPLDPATPVVPAAPDELPPRPAGPLPAVPVVPPLLPPVPGVPSSPPALQPMATANAKTTASPLASRPSERGFNLESSLRAGWDMGIDSRHWLQ